MITRTHTKGDAPSTAVYSDCERYRYSLVRTWDTAGRKALFVMLNPSTATEVQNDPTVERCERRARALGFGSFCVTNIFALAQHRSQGNAPRRRSDRSRKRRHDCRIRTLGRPDRLRLGHPWCASEPRTGGRTRAARHWTRPLSSGPVQGWPPQTSALYRLHTAT